MRDEKSAREKAREREKERDEERSSNNYDEAQRKRRERWFEENFSMGEGGGGGGPQPSTSSPTSGSKFHSTHTTHGGRRSSAGSGPQFRSYKNQSQQQQQYYQQQQQGGRQQNQNQNQQNQYNQQRRNTTSGGSGSSSGNHNYRGSRSQSTPQTPGSDDTISHYKILNLEKDCGQGEIKKAYHKAALKFHPDKNKEEGASDMFRRVRLAFEVLGDTNGRKRYDADLRFARSYR